MRERRGATRLGLAQEPLQLGHALARQLAGKVGYVEAERRQLRVAALRGGDARALGEEPQQLFGIERYAGGAVALLVGEVDWRQSLVDRLRLPSPFLIVVVAATERVTALEVEAGVLGERGHVLVVGRAVHGAGEQHAVLAAHHLVVDDAGDGGTVGDGGGGGDEPDGEGRQAARELGQTSFAQHVQ